MARHGKNARALAAFGVALLVVIADRISKIAIQHAVSLFDSISVVPGWLRIIHTENPGAAFGVLSEGNAWLRSAVLIGISGLVMVFVAAGLWRAGSSLQGAATRWGLAFILGGAAGNLYDRVLRGTVTDFIEVYRGTWSFPAFNVADSAITVGAFLLIIDLLRPRSKRAGEQASLQRSN